MVRDLTPEDIETINHIKNEFEISGFTPTFEEIAEAYLENEDEIAKEEAELEKKAA